MASAAPAVVAHSGTPVAAGLAASRSPSVSLFVSGLSFPCGLAFDSAGNLYVANGSVAGTVDKVTPAGAMSVFASGLSGAEGLAFDAEGNLYVSDGGIAGTICKVTPAGAVSTFVTSGLEAPAGLAFDAAGNLYVANSDLNTVCKVTPTGAVSTFVSSGICGPRPWPSIPPATSTWPTRAAQARARSPR